MSMYDDTTKSLVDVVLVTMPFVSPKTASLRFSDTLCAFIVPAGRCVRFEAGVVLYRP